jgi:hypothetical protein
LLKSREIGLDSLKLWAPWLEGLWSSRDETDTIYHWAQRLDIEIPERIDAIEWEQSYGEAAI